MAIVSTGQITIVDLHDATTLHAWLSTSQAAVQTYNNNSNTYSPSYTSNPQVISLNLSRAGTITSITTEAENIKWYKQVGATRTEITSTSSGDQEYMTTTNRSKLTTKINIPKENNGVRYEIEGTWLDAATGLNVAFAASINLTLVQLAKAALIGNVYAPDGDFFRNNTPTTLKAVADLYKDGELSSGSRKYKWFVADSSVTTSQDADGGVGWKKITTTPVVAGLTPSVQFDTATTNQGVLTVAPAAVVNAATFKCVIIDNTGSAPFGKTAGFVTLKDLDDPILAIIDSTGGNILKNGAGSTTLACRLFRNGEEIDTGPSYAYTYKWSKWVNNLIDPNFGGAGTQYKTGKTLTVGANDIDVKATFKCEVND